jgi:hypothetical protein
VSLRAQRSNLIANVEIASSQKPLLAMTLPRCVQSPGGQNKNLAKAHRAFLARLLRL